MTMRRYTQYMYSYPHKTAYRRLEGVNLKNYVNCLAGQENGAYLHIPFCEAKCGYCNLFSVTGQGKAVMDGYLDAVERQLAQYHMLLEKVSPRFTELTVGGGTPLLLPVKQLERAFGLMKGYLYPENRPGIIVETAPNQTDAEKLSILKQAGVTRVSIGIQSFFDRELETLRRVHRADCAESALKLIKDAGFNCVNVDLIYGVPGQTEQSFLESVERAAAYEPEELFLYPLYVRHGVALERDIQNGMVLNEERACRQYCLARDYLRRLGYRQDSMRRFVKDTKESRQFSGCGSGSTLSYGCGGRSYLGSLHFCTPYALGQRDCLKQLEEYMHTEDYSEITHGYFLNRDEERRRYVIRHLLIRPGISETEYEEQFASRVLSDFRILYQWMEQGWLEEEGGMLCLTEMGLSLSDYLGPQLMSEDVKARIREWEEAHGA